MLLRLQANTFPINYLQTNREMWDEHVAYTQGLYDNNYTINIEVD